MTSVCRAAQRAFYPSSISRISHSYIYLLLSLFFLILGMSIYFFRHQNSINRRGMERKNFFMCFHFFRRLWKKSFNQMYFSFIFSHSFFLFRPFLSMPSERQEVFFESFSELKPSLRLWWMEPKKKAGRLGRTKPRIHPSVFSKCSRPIYMYIAIGYVL